MQISLLVVPILHYILYTWQLLDCYSTPLGATGPLRCPIVNEHVESMNQYHIIWKTFQLFFVCLGPVFTKIKNAGIRLSSKDTRHSRI